MSANHSHVLLGGMALRSPAPGARRGSPLELSEERGSLSVVLGSSCGVVIGYLRRRAQSVVHLRGLACILAVVKAVSAKAEDAGSKTKAIYRGCRDEQNRHNQDNDAYRHYSSSMS